MFGPTTRPHRRRQSKFGRVRFFRDGDISSRHCRGRRIAPWPALGGTHWGWYVDRFRDSGLSRAYLDPRYAHAVQRVRRFHRRTAALLGSFLSWLASHRPGAAKRRTSCIGRLGGDRARRSHHPECRWAARRRRQQARDQLAWGHRERPLPALRGSLNAQCAATPLGRCEPASR